MTVVRKMMPIGEILIEMKVISRAQLEEALRISKRTNTRVGNAIVNLGFATEADIARALGEQYRIPSIMLSSTIPDPEALKLIPEPVARKHKLIPVNIEGSNLKVAMIDPLNVFALDEIKRIVGERTIEPLVTTESEVTRAINQYYGMEGSLEEVVEKLQKVDMKLLREEDAAPEKLQKIAGETSVVQLVNMLISRSVMDGASDIHIEPDDDMLRVRLRIDGVLHEVAELPLNLHPAVLSRVKVLGELDIAEKRLPQDGRFFIKVSGREIDIRLSTLPTIYGEKAVMRLLDKGKVVLELEHLSPVPDTLEVLKKVIRRPYGMILLTGPTGSGKTTTAYTLLNLLNTKDKNLVTVEDPVEYHLKRVNQVHVNPKVGVTFASALRHILRQDPDIVMIGEIRDRETAEISIHAALTGHLVISTIHTNDAVGTVSRMLDMGIEPYLVASALTCVVGQRLIRKICSECKAPEKADAAILKELGVRLPEDREYTFYRGTGCPVCKGSGYKGRVGIYEVLLLDDEVRRLILEKKDSSLIQQAARKGGFKPMRLQGVRVAMAGHTTLEEVLQATQDIE